MIKRQRRVFGKDFKNQIITVLLSNKSTLTELAKQYELNPNLIIRWKNDFLASAKENQIKPGTFIERRRNPEVNNHELKIKIADLVLEVERMKRTMPQSNLRMPDKEV